MITRWADLAVSGLGAGAIYALVAMGYNVIFAATGVLNFAQGEFFMLGTMVGVFCYVSLGLPVAIALVATLLVVAALGALEEPVAIRPASRSGGGSFGWVISSFGYSIILASGVALLMGGKVRSFPDIVGFETSEIAGVYVDPYRLVLVGVAVAVAVGLHLLYTRTLTGRALGAVHQDREAALMRGIPAGRLAVLSFLVGGAITGLVGFLSAPLTSASASIGLTFGLKGFIAAALGGVPEIRGALFGGLLLGLIEVFGTDLAGGGYRNLVVFGVLVAVLTLRPAGLFGRASARAV